MGDHDRDAILARRALFISAALAGLACATHRNDPDPDPNADSAEPPTVVVEPPNPPTGDKRPDSTRPPWSEIMAAAPPFDVPPGLSPSEHDLLTRLASFERERYEELGKIWSTLPECSPSAADCRAWTETIETIDKVTFNEGPLCGYSPEVTHAYLQRESAHARYLRQISDLLLADLDAVVDASTNPADRQAWQAERAALEQAHPHPCLSCAAPSVEPITDAITFGPGEATLAKSNDSSLEYARSIHEANRNFKATLIVRGHTSADEPEPLAQQRAKAVAEALISLGSDRRYIEIRSYGASLPITNDEDAAGLNRRVDFEVVTP